MRLSPHNSANHPSRRERRRRLLAMTVLAYMAPLFAADPSNVDKWLRALCLDQARAAAFMPTETTEVIQYDYDLNGNLVSESVDTGSGFEPRNLYGYDTQNRLMWFDPEPTNSDERNIVTYVYDADGQRTIRGRNGTMFRYIIDRNRPFAQVLEVA